MRKPTQRDEAIKRMYALGLAEHIIGEFARERILNCSEGRVGGNDWLYADISYQIYDWEQKTGNIAYHVVHYYEGQKEYYAVLYIDADFLNADIDLEGVTCGWLHVYQIDMANRADAKLEWIPYSRSIMEGIRIDTATEKPAVVLEKETYGGIGPEEADDEWDEEFLERMMEEYDRDISESIDQLDRENELLVAKIEQKLAMGLPVFG